jgi:hypothetical protein
VQYREVARNSDAGNRSRVARRKQIFWWKNGWNVNYSENRRERLTPEFFRAANQRHQERCLTIRLFYFRRQILETITLLEGARLEFQAKQERHDKAVAALNVFVSQNFFLLNGHRCIKGDRLTRREELDRELRILEIELSDAWSEQNEGQKVYAAAVQASREHERAG